MAKSERRSRWKKKMRAIKRVKVAPKELARLEKILPKVDINMNEMGEIAEGFYFYQSPNKTQKY
jgi:hypothetical protein